MEIIIHDLIEEKVKNIYKITNNSFIISNDKKIKNCMGCFSCWTKNPGECRIKDGYENLAKLYSKANKIIIISKCCYGSYSPFVKNVLDRSIPYLLPFFKIKNKEMHHTIRYKKSFSFEVYFYGENITDEEKDIAKNMVKANCINLNVIDFNVSFLENIN
ncbi:flavodoxin family protein [Fusobacterium simiae]|uniref:Flavodoxin family protein n=1 Tax=Fusobacterium simiae TaxID=855 RepID=A0ABT4DIH2_FUSSI|nr:flavodoxin family protein [Fusobacterium simiae]MCY7008405.1 flavodoxin family protein [Fusobacterium simiae]